MFHCKSNKNGFCLVCAKYTMVKDRQSLTRNLEEAYEKHYNIPLVKAAWVPNTICATCAQALRNVEKGTRKSLTFEVPMLWREPTDHPLDCYFCLSDVRGINKAKKTGWVYPHNSSSTLPMFKDKSGPSRSQSSSVSITGAGSAVDVEVSSASMEPIAAGISSKSISGVSTASAGTVSDSCLSTVSAATSIADMSNHAARSREDSDPEFVPEEDDEGEPGFSQEELSDLIRDLGLSKLKAELLASRLREKEALRPGVKSSSYRYRERDYLPFFKKGDGFVYCCNIDGLIWKLGVKFVPSEWRLFIDGSIKSLKFVLLHNGNRLSSVPVGYSRSLKEDHTVVKIILESLRYGEYRFQICADFKMIGILLGLQSGFTKYPCFICLWDSRARFLHYSKTHVWPLRVELEVGSHNVLKDALVDRAAIIFPFLHLKLGFMKQFVTALDKDGDCFAYIQYALAEVSEAKQKAGVFTGPQIRKLVNDPEFVNHMNEVERSAWLAFVDITKNLLGKFRAEDYEAKAAEMIRTFEQLGALMSIKVHYLANHIDMFPENCADLSDEMGERFHQDMRIMEERYQGRWDENMMADYCWSLKRDAPEATHKRRSSQKSFLGVSSALVLATLFLLIIFTVFF